MRIRMTPANRKSAILTEALAMYRADGNVHMVRLAARCGCTRGVILYHFGSSDGLRKCVAEAIDNDSE